MVQSKLLSCLLLSFGTTLLFATPLIIDLGLRLVLHLNENSLIKPLWLENVAPMYLEYFAFNWTNPEDIYKPGVKPKFKEIGPFVFKETKVKDNPIWNDNGTVTFRQHHTYVFDPEKSAADITTPITTINPILVSIGQIILKNDWGFWVRKTAQVTINQLRQNMVIVRPFGEYIYEGYPDKLVKLSSTFPIKFVPKLPMKDKFAWFYNRNTSSILEGVFSMGTQFENLGLLEEWNYSNNSKYYERSCASLKGASAGEMFPPYQYGNNISVFIPDLCRPITMDFETEQDINGVRGKKYTAGIGAFDNGTFNPDNKCFCLGVCLPAGVMNISTCKYGCPVFTSLPHFLQGDLSYQNKVLGMHPNTSKHELFYTLEPITGIVLKVTLRIQINMYIQPIRYMSMFENLPRLMFPVMWMQQIYVLPDLQCILLKIFLYLPIILQLLGMIMLGCCIFLNRCVVKSLLRRSKQDNALNISTATISELRPFTRRQ